MTPYGVYPSIKINTEKPPFYRAAFLPSESVQGGTARGVRFNAGNIKSSSVNPAVSLVSAKHNSEKGRNCPKGHPSLLFVMQ